MLTKEQAFEKYGDIDNRNSYINWEGVETALQGDEWLPEFSEFKFDPKRIDDHFTLIQLSKTYYPKPDTFLDIMKKCGIELCCVEVGCPDIVEYRKEEININFLYCKTELEEPTNRMKHVAVKVTKAGRMRNGDGTFSGSGPCSAEHNFLDKLRKAIIKTPKSYDNIQKRLYAYEQTKEHALAIAQTKSRNAVITVLAGLKKGFTKEDLQSGSFGFVKFVRSQQYQKMFTMAHINAIKNGNTGELQQISENVFSEQIQLTSIENQATNKPKINPPGRSVSHPPAENPFNNFNVTPKDDKQTILKILRDYISKNSNTRVIIAKNEGAIQSIETMIRNYKNEDIESLKNMVKVIEGLDGINEEELF